VAALETLLGVRVTPGGQHPGRGTRNALVSIGPRAYIEIIGPDPEQPTPKEARPFGLDSLTAPRLVTWAANESDLSRLSKLAAQAGISLGELASGSRRRPDGLLLSWNYTNPRTVVADGIVPFFIDWGKTPHPAETASSGGRLVGLRAEHSDAERVRTQLAHLGLRLAVTNGARPALIATIEGPRGRVELR
jgi:Glyoxalase-like domain